MRYIILNDNSIYSINMIIDRVPNLILKKVHRSGTRSEPHLVPDITSKSTENLFSRCFSEISIEREDYIIYIRYGIVSWSSLLY